MRTYGGGLFAPVSWKDFKALYKQFAPEGDGQGRHWRHARHRVLTRKEIARERGDR